MCLYFTMKRNGIFDKNQSDLFWNLAACRAIFGNWTKEVLKLCSVLQVMGNFALSLNPSISDLYFGIILMHYNWLKSSLVLLTWVMIMTLSYSVFGSLNLYLLSF